MNDKLKRAVAIISLIFILVFTVSFILYLIDKTMLNGGIGGLALWSGAFGGLLALVLWISRVFPYQQIKDEERERLYKEAEGKERNSAEEQESESVSESDGETNDGETPHEND